MAVPGARDFSDENIERILRRNSSTTNGLTPVTVTMVATDGRQQQHQSLEHDEQHPHPQLSPSHSSGVSELDQHQTPPQLDSDCDDFPDPQHHHHDSLSTKSRCRPTLSQSIHHSNYTSFAESEQLILNTEKMFNAEVRDTFGSDHSENATLIMAPKHDQDVSVIELKSSHSSLSVNSGVELEAETVARKLHRENDTLKSDLKTFVNKYNNILSLSKKAFCQLHLILNGIRSQKTFQIDQLWSVIMSEGHRSFRQDLELIVHPVNDVCGTVDSVVVKNLDITDTFVRYPSESVNYESGCSSPLHHHPPPPSLTAPKSPKSSPSQSPTSHEFDVPPMSVSSAPNALNDSTDSSMVIHSPKLVGDDYKLTPPTRKVSQKKGAYHVAVTNLSRTSRAGGGSAASLVSPSSAACCGASDGAHGTGSGQFTYEISQQLIDKQIGAIERSYGGAIARQAAYTIQRAYRSYSLRKRFTSLAMQAISHKEMLTRQKRASAVAAAAAEEVLADTNSVSGVEGGDEDDEEDTDNQTTPDTHSAIDNSLSKASSSLAPLVTPSMVGTHSQHHSQHPSQQPQHPLQHHSQHHHYSTQHSFSSTVTSTSSTPPTFTTMSASAVSKMDTLHVHRDHERTMSLSPIDRAAIQNRFSRKLSANFALEDLRLQNFQQSIANSHGGGGGVGGQSSTLVQQQPQHPQSQRSFSVHHQNSTGAMSAPISGLTNPRDFYTIARQGSPPIVVPVAYEPVYNSPSTVVYHHHATNNAPNNVRQPNALNESGGIPKKTPSFSSASSTGSGSTGSLHAGWSNSSRHIAAAGGGAIGASTSANQQQQQQQQSSSVAPSAGVNATVNNNNNNNSQHHHRHQLESQRSVRSINPTRQIVTPQFASNDKKSSSSPSTANSSALQLPGPNTNNSMTPAAATAAAVQTRTSLPQSNSTTNSSTVTFAPNISEVSSNHSEPANSAEDACRKRRYRVGLNLFNKSPSERGIQFLISNNFIDQFDGNDQQAKAVAQFLHTRKGLSRQMIGEYISENKDFNKLVLRHFCLVIDFAGSMVDEALRYFQSFFRFPGEAQKIERLVDSFADRYKECNPGDVLSRDSVFILAFAIIMLNTDLHKPTNSRHRMTPEQWLNNLKGVFLEGDLSNSFLIGIYKRIKKQELVTGTDHVSQVIKVQSTIVGRDVPNFALPHRRLVCYCSLYEIRDLNRYQRTGQHQRDIFLFNDLLLITKATNRARHGTLAEYQYRSSTPLDGLQVLVFSTVYYPNGVRISRRVDNKLIACFNARNDLDQQRFVDDLQEAINEMDEMEQMRIQKSNSLVQLNAAANANNNIGRSPLDPVTHFVGSNAQLTDNNRRQIYHTAV